MKSADSNANPNKVSQTSQSWAHTVSDYLLQRQAQNKQVYELAFTMQGEDKQQGSADNVDDEQNTDWLFKSLFIALAQQLEEGHTVLTLSTAVNENMATGLYSWQQQLLTIILSPLYEHIEQAAIFAQHRANQTNEMTDLNIESIERALTLWPQVSMQLALAQEANKILKERHDLGQKIYNHFSSTNQIKVNQNSLSKYKNLLTKSLMFATTNTKNTAPIRFKEYYQGNDYKITLWLQRTWQAEHTLAQKIQAIIDCEISPLPIAINVDLNPQQQAAISMASNHTFSIITGGPGTGKTYTIAQLVIALKGAQVTNNTSAQSTDKKGLNLALAAPTGKAAQRMQESLQSALDFAKVDMQLQEAKTIHRLLGIGQSGRPRYNEDNPLSEDIIIIDEASMLGVELANRLISAVKPGARLILLGDANQLAAVDAGAVLADLCRIPMLESNHQQLTESRRFDVKSGIGKLAAQINSLETDMSVIWQLLAMENTLAFKPLRMNADKTNSMGENTEINEQAYSHQNQTSLKMITALKEMQKNYSSYINTVNSYLNGLALENTESNVSIVSELLSTLNQFRILTAGHHGPCGDNSINRYLSEQHRAKLKLPLSKSAWYHGRPVMVQQNNYELGLFNGDIGICLQTSKGQLQVFFENKTRGIAINLFGDEMVATAYAMTIHKSQGSEFSHVAICFDESNARLLSQELIYTAVTRAKEQITIYSTESAMTRALNTPTVRQTGLSLQFEAL